MESGSERRVWFDMARDVDSPRFRAIIRATSGRRRRSRAEIKSFSHELDSQGARRRLPLRRFRGMTSAEDVMTMMRTKFNRLKEEVNAELAVFSGDLDSIIDKTGDDHPDWRADADLEELLKTCQNCAEMLPEEFWINCEQIVQNLDARRQKLPMGTLKHAHTRLLFILARCTRLLQFQKEGMLGQEDRLLGLHQCSDLGYYCYGHKGSLSGKEIKERLIQKGLNEHRMSQDLSDTLQGDNKESIESPASRNRISSWKKLPSVAERNRTKGTASNIQDTQCSLPPWDNRGVSSKTKYDEPSKDHVDTLPTMICRICDCEISTLHAEGHLKVCNIADRCDSKGLSINERLERVAQVLEKISGSGSGSVESLNFISGYHNAASSEGLCMTKVTDGLSSCGSKMSQPSWVETRGVPEAIVATVNNEDLSQSSACNACSNVIPGHAHQYSRVNLLSSERCIFAELDNLQKVHKLLGITHHVININSGSYASLECLSSCLEDLNGVIENRKVDGLIVETFGRRVEKLLQEKFIYICGQIDDENEDFLSTDRDGSADSDYSQRSLAGPFTVKLKDRTSIEDFEIIKPISRGAFGRVFLAKKRITGDLFAIKVLKKADMIRKNAVESILAERNILISVRNPFVVRFYYSFTCRENLYLVMEYLPGGDLYSLLRNLGCLDEEMARMYIAELGLALEYLHSLNVIHRDLKPDNLLIARDGHIKLTDFGLSKVGLITSTDDLSGPDVSSSILFEDRKPLQVAERAQNREQRQKQETVGTPDYLAPEILLGMSHGQSADWWSVGVILFELLAGIPPFNAEHPQKIFDNIMNGDIPWPKVPEEMSHEAFDLIDKLLDQNPLQRLGANGSAEVKSHPFFKCINWDMLSYKKASFIPSTEGDEDTSFFESRHSWNSADYRVPSYQYDDDLSDTSISYTNSPLSQLEEDDDEYAHLADFESRNLTKKYSFSNFSYKNLTQLASINYELIKKSGEELSNATNS